MLVMIFGLVAHLIIPVMNIKVTVTAMMSVKAALFAVMITVEICLSHLLIAASEFLQVRDHS